MNQPTIVKHTLTIERKRGSKWKHVCYYTVTDNRDAVFKMALDSCMEISRQFVCLTRIVEEQKTILEEIEP